MARARRSPHQINFVNLIISDLAQNGVIAPSRFYDAPYNSVSSTGPQGLFTSEQIQELDGVLESVRNNAAA
jgi:type I restriction enzyme R subunit